MIVVDTNVISYLLIPGDKTQEAEAAARKDEWCAPLLWRSEFRSVLTLYLRRRQMRAADARELMRAAERLLWGREFTVHSDTVLDCITRSARSAYDCEFAALAMDLGLKLVTTDEPLIADFPNLALHLGEYVSSS